MHTCSKGGWGFPRQKLESVQVAFRSMESFEFSFSCDSRGPRALWPRTKSRHLGESPAMFPKAHTACNVTISHAHSITIHERSHVPLPSHDMPGRSKDQKHPYVGALHIHLVKGLVHREGQRLFSYLLPDIVAGGRQELHKDGNSPVVDHNTCMLRCAGRNVRQRPGGLKLHMDNSHTGKEFKNEDWAGLTYANSPAGGPRGNKARGNTIGPWSLITHTTEQRAATCLLPRLLLGTSANQSSRSQSNLQLRVIISLQELCEGGHHSRLDDFLDRRTTLCHGQSSPTRAG